MDDAQTPRQAWAAAVRRLLEAGAWIGAARRPVGQDALVKAFATQMVGKPDCPSAPDKAVVTWLGGGVPFPKAFGLICLLEFGTSAIDDECCATLRGVWETARRSRKSGRDDGAPVSSVIPSAAPTTMAELSWSSPHAWQTVGLATLYVDPPAFQNERDAYRLRLSVSFGTDEFTIDRTTFSVGLTDARLEPDYRNCHPVPGTAPGETEPHDHIEFAGGRYRFKGPKPDGHLLFGNPFGTDSFAEIAWDRPGANDVTLTLSSQRTALEFVQIAGPKLRATKERLIQQYLRVKRSPTELGSVHWARATVRGSIRK